MAVTYAARAKGTAATLLTSVRWHWLATYPSWDSQLLAWRSRYDVNSALGRRNAGYVEVVG